MAGQWFGYGWHGWAMAGLWFGYGGMVWLWLGCGWARAGLVGLWVCLCINIKKQSAARRLNSSAQED